MRALVDMLQGSRLSKFTEGIVTEGYATLPGLRVVATALIHGMRLVSDRSSLLAEFGKIRFSQGFPLCLPVEADLACL
jgi:hypothetical protein